MNTDLHHVSDAWIAAQRHRDARDVASELFLHFESQIAILEDLGMTVAWGDDVTRRAGRQRMRLS